MQYSPNEEWYAIRVRYRHEEVVQKALSAKSFNPLYLTYQELSKRKDRKKILTKAFFPGYMFIKTVLDANRHVEVLKSLGVVQIIHNSEGPIPIPEYQIQNIEKLKEWEGKIIPVEGLATGMLVRVVHGPLTGLLGRIDEMMKDFIKISIDNVPSSIAIQIPAEDVEPV